MSKEVHRNHQVASKAAKLLICLWFQCDSGVAERLEVIYWICSVWTKHFSVGSCAHNIANWTHFY